ncbi:MAG: sugar phosphate isomerase/epimerase [Anaerolineae bacterium]|nr:sugar phosphate isomerase/epimerase [Anaerolineae bacterium]
MDRSLPKISLSTACFYQLPLHLTFRLAKEAGFSGVEVVLSPEVSLRGTTFLHRLAQRFGLAIFSVHQSLFHPGPLGKNFRHMLQATKVALSLKAPLVVLHVPWASSWQDPEAQHWLQAIQLCQKLTQGSGTQLSIENPGIYSAKDAANVLAKPDELVELADRFGLGITFDTCHAGTSGMDLSKELDLLDAHLVNVHLSDLAQNEKFPQAFFAHHQLPGQGDLPLRTFLAQLHRRGFAGPITLEANPLTLWGWSFAQMRNRLQQALSFISSAMLGAAESSASGEGECH